MAFRLFTTYYKDKRPQRQEELDMCLSLNASAFDAVHVLEETLEPEPLPAFQFRPRSVWWWCGDEDRRKFSDVLNEARRCVTDDIAFIANCDIAFPRESLERISENLQPNQAYALTRWEVSSKQGVHLWDVEYSQDAWVFRGPPKPDIGGDYWFGVPGCDNRFAHELDAAGYEVLNPSKDIRTYHVHASNERTATNTEAHRVPPPYLYIAPHHLGEAPTINRAATYEQRKQVIARRRARA